MFMANPYFIFRPAIKIFDICTHAQMDARLWESVNRQMIRKGSEYRSRYVPQSSMHSGNIPADVVSETWLARTPLDQVFFLPFPRPLRYPRCCLKFSSMRYSQSKHTHVWCRYHSFHQCLAHLFVVWTSLWLFQKYVHLPSHMMYIKSLLQPLLNGICFTFFVAQCLSYFSHVSRY